MAYKTHHPHQMSQKYFSGLIYEVVLYGRLIFAQTLLFKLLNHVKTNFMSSILTIIQIKPMPTIMTLMQAKSMSSVIGPTKLMFIFLIRTNHSGVYLSIIYQHFSIYLRLLRQQWQEKMWNCHVLNPESSWSTCFCRGKSEFMI